MGRTEGCYPSPIWALLEPTINTFYLLELIANIGQAKNHGHRTSIDIFLKYSAMEEVCDTSITKST